MDRLRQIVSAAELQSGDAVLDVGTGAGVLIALIQPYRPSLVVACDLSEQMLARVHKRYPFVFPVQCDIVQLPLKPATVDVVFMNAMFGNIADKPAAISNAARVLRRGGRLLVSHPEGRGFVEELRATSELFIESFPTQSEFQTLLDRFMFEVVAYRDESRLYLMVARKA